MIFAIVLIVLLVLVMFPIIIATAVMKNRATDKPKGKPLWDDDSIKIPDIALYDQTLKYYIEQGEMLHAVEAFQAITDSDVETARQAVYYMARMAKAKGRLAADAGAGIRDLLADGRIDEAVEAYRIYNGVDLYTAQDAVEKMMQIGD
jgi:hypothetical protein